MNKILFISYGIKEFDGRMEELIEICGILGKVKKVFCSKKKCGDLDDEVITINDEEYLSLKLYLKFFVKSMKEIIKNKDYGTIFIDNLYAAPIGLVSKVILKNKTIIQDCRELYFKESMPGIGGKLFCWCEEKLMKKSEIVICANEVRSRIMKERFDLKESPIVFENIRFLKGDYDLNYLNLKYKHIFNSDKVNLVCTGGLSIQRRTNDLVLAMKYLSESYHLYIIGGGSEEDKKTILNTINKKNIGNVTLIDKVPMSELRYIVSKCDIGIVNYHQNDLNNEYCASGKVYEYLAEGLPIVTTENRPLKSFCEINKVGIADNDFYNGIKKVNEDLSIYKERAVKFIKNISVKDYKLKTAECIKIKLEKSVNK